MPRLVRCHGWDLDNSLTTIATGPIPTLLRVRTTSGDIVLDDNGTVRQADDWLWEWERCDPGCYARSMQRRYAKAKGE